MTWIATGVWAASKAIDYFGDKKAEKAQQQGIAKAEGIQQQALAQTRTDLQPYMDLGTAGASGLQRLLADPNSIADSAAYQWRVGQGLQGLDRSAAARGALFSGGHSADLIRFGQGEAAQEYGNQWQRLAGLASTGQNTATNLGNLGQGHAATLGGLAMGSADVRASGYQNQASNINQLAYGVGGGINDWYQANKARNPGGTGWYLGNNPGRG